MNTELQSRLEKYICDNLSEEDYLKIINRKSRKVDILESFLNRFNAVAQDDLNQFRSELYYASRIDLRDKERSQTTRVLGILRRLKKRLETLSKTVDY